MSRRSRDRRRERRVAVASAGQTIVSLVVRTVEECSPWPLTRVLTALGAFEVERLGVAQALGDRRGVPLVHSQELRWLDHALFLQFRHGRDGVDELSCEMPAWDELVPPGGDDEVWRFLDTVAASADALFGSLGDGEPPELVLPDDPQMLRAQLRRHLALLLPEWAEDDVEAAGATVARTLPESGLLVVTP